MRSVRLSAVAGSRVNNFDVLRLAAAGLVLVSHSFPLTGHRGPLVSHPLGTAGVEVFFAISGFLVTKSWLGDPSLRRFLRKRAFRIFPGLIGSVTVTALVIGTVFTAGSITGYLDSRLPWGYIVSNMILLPHYDLPSVFTTNPYPSANGSLWTLPIEMRAYILLGLLGLVGLARRRAIGVAAMLLVVLNATTDTGPAMQLTSVFIGGSALYLLRDLIVLRADLAALLLLVWLAAYESRFSTAVGIIALPYLVAYAAYCSPARLGRLAGKGDVSYGVYVYAFPIQQSIVAIAGGISPLFLTVIAAPIVWLAGFASWRLVEEPMLRWKRAQPPSRKGAGGRKSTPIAEAAPGRLAELPGGLGRAAALAARAD
jgi:peptidoglycan/LPS O-acetylase OafA/YrhL